MQRLFVTVLGAALISSTVVADEQPIGRYQAIALPKSNPSDTGQNVFILDTRDGHVWTWWHLPTVGGVMVNGTTYQGRLTPQDPGVAKAVTPPADDAFTRRLNGQSAPSPNPSRQR